MNKPFSKYDFITDLKYGTDSEKNIAEILGLNGKEFEVKTERDWWTKTGNIAIELECNKKPSGINVTQARYWVHAFQDKDDLSRSELAQLLLGKQYDQLKKDDNRTDASVVDRGDPRYFEFSDATLQILNSNYKPSVLINFKDTFPTSLSTLDFDVSQRDYSFFTAQVSFKYTIFNITDPNGNRIDNLFKK